MMQKKTKKKKKRIRRKKEVIQLIKPIIYCDLVKRIN